MSKYVEVMRGHFTERMITLGVATAEEMQVYYLMQDGSNEPLLLESKYLLISKEYWHYLHASHQPVNELEHNSIISTE